LIFEVEEDTKPQKMFPAKALLNWFDAGSETISINYSGKGHGSKLSVCVSSIFAVTFLVFLNLAGVFQYTSQTQQYYIRSEAISYNFEGSEIVVSSTSPISLSMRLIDGNFKQI
jgi:hypothetical protein